MAKKSNTQDDPATLAFSAVEDALKDSVFGGPAEGKPSPVQSTPQGPRPSPRNDRSRVSDKQAALAGSVANDDRFQGSRILYGLQSRSSQTPNYVAMLVAALWVFAILGVSIVRDGKDFGAPGFFASDTFIGILALAIIPVLGFFAIATLIRRAQDLRNAATAVTHAAIRLAEPETTASEKVASVGQAVRREVNALGDGLERALSRAGELEVMIHNEVTALERTYSDNEARMRALIQELTSQREAVITNTERVREAITESHTGLVFDLDMISQRIAGTIVESGGNLTKALETAGNSLNGAFGERTESFVTLIDQRTSHLLTALDDSASRLNITLEDRASTISGAFENRTTELSAVIDGRMGSLTEALDSRAVTLSEAIENRTSSLAKLLSQGGITLLDQLRDRGQEVSSALDMIGSRIASDISARSHEAEEMVGNLSKQLDEVMQAQVNAMESKLHTTMIELNGAMDETTERARVTLMGAGSQNLTQFDQRLEEIAVVIDTRLQSLDAVVGDKGEKLVAALEKHNAGFSARANVLELALDEKSGHFNDIVNQRTREMVETLNDRSKQITEIIGNRSREISDALEGHSQILADALDGGTTALRDTLQSRTAELSDMLVSRGGEINEVLTGRTTLLEKTLDNHLGQIGGAIDTRAQQLAQAVGARSAELGDALTSHTASMANAIGERTLELARAIESQGTAARDKIDAALHSVNGVMTDRATAISSLIASKVAEVNDNLGRGIDTAILRIADAESGVSSRIESAAATVGDSARHAADIIETGVNSARKAITDMVDQRLGTLPEAITARADITAERLSSLNTAINTALVQSMADLEAGADRIEETISKRIVQATSSITLDVAETADRMDTHVRQALEQIHNASRSIDEVISIKAVAAAEAIETRLTTLTGAVTTQTDDLAALVAQRSSEIESTLRSNGNVLQEALAASIARSEQLSSQIENMLRSHGNVLQDALAASVTRSEQLMTATTDRIQADSVAAFQRLEEANLTLSRVLETAGINLSQLETTIADRTQGYTAAVREAAGSSEEANRLVANQVATLQATVRDMVEQVGVMMQSLHNEVSAIDTSAASLSQAGAQSLEALEERRAAMDALAQTFAARADQIDERMRGFAQTIADGINETERRLLDTRGQIEEVLATSAADVATHLTNFSSSATTETEKASDTLRQTQATMILEMQQALEEATRRFTETADTMRQTAKDVGSTLEATRSELAKGVIELPEETRTTAAAMRRVVAEQIEALTELNAIVRSQSATHDLTDRRTPRQDAPRPAEPRQEPSRREAPRPEPARSAEPLRPAARTVTLGEPAPLRPAPAPVPAPAAAQAPVAEAQRPAENGGGWLRDVLRNANTPSAPQPQGLNTLTDEIARSIDPVALADAWRRYQQGEQNVFSRRVYTLSGQATFDEIKRRMTRDADFTKNAQSYMSEFEQLLQRAAAGPDPVGETRAILTSDRGKVYTMLAHASGRLG